MAKKHVTSVLVSGWVPKTVQELDATVLDMATDIHRGAVILAPKLSRALVNSGQVIRVATGHYRVRFGSGSVRYARRRHFENKANPQTLKYLERAGDNVVRGDIRKYLR